MDVHVLYHEGDYEGGIGDSCESYSCACERNKEMLFLDNESTKLLPFSYNNNNNNYKSCIKPKATVVRRKENHAGAGLSAQGILTE